MTLFGLIIVLAVLLLAYAVLTRRVDPIAALVAVIIVLVLWYFLAGSPDMTVRR